MADTATIAVLLSDAAGFALRTFWDSYIKTRDAIRVEIWKTQADQLERSLSQFYWPLCLRLQRDNVVWRRILDKSNAGSGDSRLLAVEVEKSVSIPNHRENIKIIESSIH